MSIVALSMMRACVLYKIKGGKKEVTLVGEGLLKRPFAKIREEASVHTIATGFLNRQNIIAWLINRAYFSSAPEISI